MSYAVILAARMGSGRFPGKVLSVYSPDGEDNLTKIVRRWQASDREPTVIITTTTNRADDAIAAAGAHLGVPVSRGDPLNVVAQIDHALRTYALEATHVARALADNPLVDVGLADWRLDVLRETGADGVWWGGREADMTYAATTDIWSRAAWDRIVAESSGSQLEHPGELYWNRLHTFNVVQLPMPRAEYLQPFKTELDTPADLEMLRALWRIAYGDLRANVPPLDTLLALKVLKARPDVAAMNADVAIKTQSRAIWPNHWKPWICDNCKRRGGSLVEGNLRVFCASCGQAHTYYAHKPQRRGYVAE